MKRHIFPVFALRRRRALFLNRGVSAVIWRDKFSRKTRIILTIGMIAAFSLLDIYAVILDSQFVARFVFQKGVSIAFPPFVCFRYAFFFDYSRKETYGSAKQMTEGEIKRFFKVLPATVIRNIGGAKSDPFWNDAEMNFLKVVILLKSVGEADISNRKGKKQTLCDDNYYIIIRKVLRWKKLMSTMTASISAISTASASLAISAAGQRRSQKPSLSRVAMNQQNTCLPHLAPEVREGFDRCFVMSHRQAGNILL